jgi:hypothetical protein
MAIDENKEYTSADMVSLDDALSLAVIGYSVRAVDMQEGSFIDYQFAGFRINFPGGSSSGWRARDHDKDVDWHVIDDEHVDAYKRVVMDMNSVTTKEQAKATALHSQAWGRALRPVPPAPPAGLVIDAGAKVWGLNDRAAPVAPPAPAVAPDNVGKWGKAVVPPKDKWGKPS